jgi:hypothetical protein
MKHTLILFGHMTHGTFTVGEDEAPMVMVHSIQERAIMNPADVDEYMHSEGHDSYLIPDEFTGEVVFSQTFFKGLIND